jgi:sec-independent protein translocase protein TatA
MLAEIFGVDGVIVLIVVVVLLFGSTQLPKLARSLGSAQNEFKKGLAEGHKDDATADPKATDAKASDSATGDSAPDTTAPKTGDTSASGS